MCFNYLSNLKMIRTNLIKHIKNKKQIRMNFKLFIIMFFILFLCCFFVTYINLNSVPSSLKVIHNPNEKYEFLDRNGEKLSVTYATKWNVSDYVKLDNIPQRLIDIFIFVEDKRFYEHGGVDWKARFSGLFQIIKTGHIVRGASTISEQVIKMLHKRKRTFFNKWLEGIESHILENKFSKNEILEFYLNEVPYARNIRGVKKASKYYFDRDLGILNLREIISLAILLRSPSILDPKNDIKNLERIIDRTSFSLFKAKKISALEYDEIKKTKLALEEPKILVDASHFIRFISNNKNLQNYSIDGKIYTSLDASLQKIVQNALAGTIKNYKNRNVNNGAAIVVNLQSNEILAYAVFNGGNNNDIDVSKIDALQILRQPGSTLKPFLYTKALEMGWTASTIINDEPLAEGVNKGIHRYRNFSGTYYGPLRLREALANSLNTPAVRTINFVKEDVFLETLKQLGFKSLKKSASFYGGGLALGNGEVTLYELSRAYSVLARSGIYKDFNFALYNKNGKSYNNEKNFYRVFSVEDSDIINNILQDRKARRKEFGVSSLYDFNVPVSFKTGTSSDFRDAFVVGYTNDFLVAVWFGNYDRSSMDKITGSSGPMSVLKIIMGKLNLRRGIKESKNLIELSICEVTGLIAGKNCPKIKEIYKKENLPKKVCLGAHDHKEQKYDTLKILYPIDKMTLAIDKRIPLKYQAINFEIYPFKEKIEVNWWLDGKKIGESKSLKGRFPWNLQKGKHKLKASIFKDHKSLYSNEVGFEVR